MTEDLISRYIELVVEATLDPTKYRKQPGFFSRDKNPYYDYSPLNKLATRIYEEHGEDVLQDTLNDALNAVREVGGDEAYEKLDFAIRTGCITFYKK
jgi:hypothetical protein